MARPPDDFMRRLLDAVDPHTRKPPGWFTAPRVAALLLGVLGVLIVAGGYFYHHCECRSWPNLVVGWEQEFEALYANLATTLVGIAIAVFTIDWLNERRAEQQLKAQLIREMGSADNGIALRAVRELRAHGSEDVNWLTDGSLRDAYLIKADLHDANLSDANLQRAILQQTNLQGAFLLGANLQGADLVEADLQRANLEGTNLEGADLRGANLQKTILVRANLRGANLHEANLQGANLTEADLRWATLQGADLQGADLRGNLQRATLEGPEPYWNGLDEPTLLKANLEGANLQDATMPDGSIHE